MKTPAASLLATSLFAVVVALSTSKESIGAVVSGPVAYTSTADIPAGFYAGGNPTALEDFEDGTLDFGISASSGFVFSGEPTVDSVDADDGVIDGSGLDGRSWAVLQTGESTSVTFTFSGALPTAAALVWTDGAIGSTVRFEAFGAGMISLGEFGPFSFPDATNTGTTAEDRFFGVRETAGVLAVRLTNDGGGVGGIEVDHVQFGTAVPEPASSLILGALACTIALRRPRRCRG